MAADVSPPQHKRQHVKIQLHGSPMTSSLDSLRISPNLELLLEYDEKVRARTMSASAPTSPNPPGLRPRPRGLSESPRSLYAPSPPSPPILALGPVKNPYINPSPSFRVVEEAVDDNKERSPGEEPMELGMNGMTAALPRSVDDCREKRPSQIEQVVDRFKTGFRFCPSPSPSGPRVIASASSPPASPSFKKHFDFGKYAGSRKQISKADKTQAVTETTTDMREIVIAHPEPNTRRSLSSSSSSSSSTSVFPNSILDEEPRISISSTLYSDGYQPSLPHSFYAPTQMQPTLRVSRPDSVNTSRESFLDFRSQTSPISETPARTRHDSSHDNDYNNYQHDPQHEHSSSRKPPIPTAPKPKYPHRPPSTMHKSRSHSPNPPPPASHSSSSFADVGSTNQSFVPPTTNFLNATERADLIRKSRKLAKVFGQTPGPESLTQPDNRQRHQRGAVSISTTVPRNPVGQQDVWPPVDGTQYLNASGRRHSSALAADDFPFLAEVDDGSSIRSKGLLSIGPDSPTSFMNLTDEESNDGAAISPNTPKGRRPTPSSPATRSVFENMTPVEQAEEERRRKREKLARVHRFLGSRVPPNLVLGLPERGLSAPPTSPLMFSDSEERHALRRRRSSSAAAFPSHWTDELDRHDLDEREKALNVRRAHKMAKVFGEAPPLTLYHTRHSPSASAGPGMSTSTSLFTGGLAGQSSKSTGRDGPPTPLVISPSVRNRSRRQLSYSKSNRPGTAESIQQLLPDKPNSGGSGPSTDFRSNVYTHYQHSINSLHDILDRDDKESLAELREYLDSDESPPAQSPVLQEFARTPDRRLSSNASTKSERRRSLPAKTSLLSLSSEYSISSPDPEITSFQQKRRRAAKLQHFFGENYNMLIGDVLESIEKGVEEERKRGTLDPDEFDDLVTRLRSLKVKRTGSR